MTTKLEWYDSVFNLGNDPANDQDCLESKIDDIIANVFRQSPHRGYEINIFRLTKNGTRPLSDLYDYPDGDGKVSILSEDEAKILAEQKMVELSKQSYKHLVDMICIDCSMSTNDDLDSHEQRPRCSKCGLQMALSCRSCNTDIVYYGGESKYPENDAPISEATQEFLKNQKLNPCIYEKINGCEFELKLLNKAFTALDKHDQESFHNVAKQLENYYQFFIAEGIEHWSDKEIHDTVFAIRTLHDEIAYYLNAYKNGIENPTPFSLVGSGTN